MSVVPSSRSGLKTYSLLLSLVVLGCANETQPEDTPNEPEDTSLPVYAFLDGSALTGVNYSDVATADMDGDGDIDIIQCGYNGSNALTEIYLNNEGTFELLTTPLDSDSNGVGDEDLDGVEYECSLSTGDVENDGDVDLIATGAGAGFSESTYLFINQGNNVFTSAQRSVTDGGNPLVDLLGTGQGHVNFVDVNNDNQLDIVLSASNDDANQSTLYLNNGDNTFTVLDTPVDGSGVFLNKGNGTNAWGDFNNDDYMDLVFIAGQSASETHVYRNNQDETFTKLVNPVDGDSEFQGLFGGPISVVDYDNDGDNDIAVSAEYYADPSYNAFTAVYENRRDIAEGRFEEVSLMLDTTGNGVGDTTFFENYISDFFFADMDGENGLDIVALGGNGKPESQITKVYLNISKAVYEAIESPVDSNGDDAGDTTFPQLSFGGIAVGDFDNDGDNDIVLNGQDGGSVRYSAVYKNMGNGLFVEGVGAP